MIIGITGLKRSGKTTLANMLSKELNLPVLSFADPIRRAVADILGITLADLEVCKEKPIEWLGGVTPRHMMQTLGTEWGRQMIHPEMWVRAMGQQATKKGFITADVRFENEAAMIREQGGIILRVIRPGLRADDAHISEKQIDLSYVTADVYNHGSPEDLLATALRLLV